jgi:hypothetical protein
MGVSYSYANLDRLEYFSLSALGGGNKARSLGRNLEARALGLLLRPPAPVDTAHVGPGAWAGGRIAAVGDSDTSFSGLGLPGPSENSAFAHMRDEFRDISSGVLVMMIAYAADELLDAAEKSERLRMALGDLAEIYRCTDAADVLQSRFGPDWRSAYARARKASPGVVPAP